MKWFKHFSDASDDEFLAELEELFGLEGYARWWKLLEAVAKQMDETAKCSVSYSWQKWQTILKGKRNKLVLFLEHSQNKGKLFLKQTGNILEIKIPKLLELRDNHTKRSVATTPLEVEEEVDVVVYDSAGAEKPPSEFLEISLEIQKLMAGRIMNTQRVHAWLEQGADKALILETLKVCMERRNNSPLGSLSYFDQPIANAITAKTSPLPQGNYGTAQSNHSQSFNSSRKQSVTEAALDCIAAVKRGDL